MLSHRVDIYGFDLVLARTRRQLRKASKAFGQKIRPDALASTTSLTAGDHFRQVYIVWIDTAAHTHAGELIDTCAHEACHITDAHLCHIGHQPGERDEAAAYLTGWLTRWLWERTHG